MNKQEESVYKRIEEGKISKEISYDMLTKDEPNAERMYGRLEAWLGSGVVIDSEDLKKVLEEYSFSVDQCKKLGLISHKGILEGLVQEPDNMPHYGSRIGCLSTIASYCLEKEGKK